MCSREDRLTCWRVRGMVDGLRFWHVRGFGGCTEVLACNNNNNVHLSCAHQRPERSHDTYKPKYDNLYTCRA